MARLARTEVFDPHDIAVVHVMNRVVRRCYLLGDDPVSGKNFDHRKTWIEDELKRLAAAMGIDLLCFACLSNHFHLVLRSRPDVVQTWSDEEVARRWCLLCPRRRCDGRSAEPGKPEIAMIINCPQRLAEIRLRLSDISWWMRILCQKIAVRANNEDGEVGKFWQSRYRSVRLLDEEALIACAAYVDLNPIRAAVAQTLDASDFTSVKRRIETATGLAAVERELEQDPRDASPDWGEPDEKTTDSGNAQGPVDGPSFLCPLQLYERNGEVGPCASQTGQRCSDKGFLPMSLSSYLSLLDWTSRQWANGKATVTTSRTVPPILEKLRIREEVWCELVSDFGRLFSVVAGQPHRIDEHRSRMQQRRYRVPRRTRQLLADGSL
ncbi:MAG: transposase [Planctomycetaceae bacterium]